MWPTVCEVCAEGRAALDADNDLGPEGAASLVPALEKMPQLTSLDLSGARIRFGRGLEGLGGRGFGAFVGVRAWMRCGVVGGMRLRAGDAADRL